MSDYFMNLFFNFGPKRLCIFVAAYLVILVIATVRFASEKSGFYESFAYLMSIMVLSFVIGIQIDGYVSDVLKYSYSAWAFGEGAGLLMLLYGLVLTVALFDRILLHTSEYVSINKKRRVKLMTSWLWGSIYAVLCFGSCLFVAGIISDIYFLHDPSHPMPLDLMLMILIFVGPIILVRLYPKLVERLMNVGAIKRRIIEVQGVKPPRVE